MPAKMAQAAWRIREHGDRRVGRLHSADGPIALAVVVHVPMPASIPKRERMTARPVRRPDLDEAVKTAMDGLSPLWDDDAQVVELHAEKRFAVNQAPRWEIAVEGHHSARLGAAVCAGGRPQRTQGEPWDLTLKISSAPANGSGRRPARVSDCQACPSLSLSRSATFSPLALPVTSTQTIAEQIAPLLDGDFKRGPPIVLPPSRLVTMSAAEWENAKEAEGNAEEEWLDDEIACPICPAPMPRREPFQLTQPFFAQAATCTRRLIRTAAARCKPSPIRPTTEKTLMPPATTSPTALSRR